MNKPHITIRRLYGEKCYSCCNDRAEAHGDTPEKAYLNWKVVCRVMQLTGTERCFPLNERWMIDMIPFSLLKYVKTTYSNSSKVL